jgi:predicted MFS family arabinose efflux permease
VTFRTFGDNSPAMAAEAPPLDEFRALRPVSGRRIVAASFVLAVFAWGLGFYGLSVYTQFLGADGRWSLRTLSLATTVYFICGSLSIGLVDRLARRHGRRRIALLGIAALAGGVALLPRLPWPSLLFVAYAVMAFGWAATSGTAITQIVGAWFDARRGLALSLALTGASVAGFTVVPGMVWAISRLGVAAGLGLTALCCAIVAVIAVAMLVERPGTDPRARSVAPSVATTERTAAMGEAAMGEAATAAQPAAPRDDLGTGRALARHRHALTITFALGWFAQVAFLSQQVPLLAQRIGALPAATAVALTTMAAIAGRLLLGFASDRGDPRLITAGCLVAQTAGLGLVLAADGRTAIYAGCLLFGIGVGNLITLPAIVVQREFEAARYASMVSRIWAVGQFFYAFAPISAGLLIEARQPRAVLVGCIALELAAAALCLAGRRPGRR